MAIYFETIEGDEIETGFWGPNTSTVHLGELPSMTTPQFAGYAGLILAEVVPSLDPETRRQFTSDVHTVHERVEVLPTLNISGKFITPDLEELASQLNTVEGEDKGELLSALSAAAVPAGEAVHYKESPFRVLENGQLVGFEDGDERKHIITAEDFLHLVFRIMRGGMAGWDEYGTYQEIKDLSTRFEKALAGVAQ